MLAIVLFAAGVVLLLNVVVALVSAYPHILVRGAVEMAHCPDPYQDVDIGGGLLGWWLSAPKERLAIILVHGWAGNGLERWVPFQALAEALRDAGVSTLQFDLGYVGGRRMYSGGAREADDVLQAARWVRGRVEVPIVLWGFSAGGHAVLLAAQREPDLPLAVVVDSAFPESGRMVASRAARMLHVPSPLLALAPCLLSMLTGSRAEPLGRCAVPTLLIHGTNDQEVPLAAADRLQQITGARLHTVEGAEHEGAFRRDPKEYLAACIAFVDGVGEAAPQSLSRREAPGHSCPTSG